MQTISAKPFAVGQELKVKARSSAASAVRSPVVVRASQEAEAVSWRFSASFADVFFEWCSRFECAIGALETFM